MNDLLHNPRGLDAGEPLIESLEAVSQLSVVESQQVQNRGVQVVNMHLVFGHVKAEIVAGA